MNYDNNLMEVSRSGLIVDPISANYPLQIMVSVKLLKRDRDRPVLYIRTSCATPSSGVSLGTSVDS